MSDSVYFLVFGDILIFGKFENFIDLWSHYCYRGGYTPDMEIPIFHGAGFVPKTLSAHPHDSDEWKWDDCTDPKDYCKINDSLHLYKKELDSLRSL